MAKGLKKITRIAEESKAKRDAYDAHKQSGDSDFQRALVLKPGQVATGRFCEEGEDVTFVYTHDLPLAGGQSIPDKVLCLNQDDESHVACYGCERAGDGVRRGARLVMNFIRYDEPKLMREDNGRPVRDNFKNYQYEMKTDPQTGQQVIVTEYALVIFSTGTSIGSRLAFLESQKGGMTNHVVTIARTSDNTSPYMIDILEADKKPSDVEEAIFNKKIDPIQAITKLGKRSIPAMAYNDMVRAFGGSVASGFSQSGAAPTGNPYADAANQAGGVINRGAFGN
jgi:hypothetical protein